MSASIERLKLADGRRLAYREYGDPAGLPVISCHGGLVDGADIGFAGQAAHDAGLRLISPDRPGVGSSDRSPGHTLLDWPRDVASLADQLGLSRFAAIGWSMGAAYAAALAFALPQRVTGVALIAGAPPLDDRQAFAVLNRMDRRLVRLSQRSAPLARAQFRAIGFSAGHMPRAFARASKRSMEGHGREYAPSVARAMSQPRGMVDEYLVFGAAWGFDGGAIEVPTRIWHGDADQLCPPALVQLLARAIPSAELTTIAGAGHFLLHEHAREVFAWLAATR